MPTGGEEPPTHAAPAQAPTDPPDAERPEAYGFTSGEGYPSGQRTAALEALDVAADVLGVSTEEVDGIVIPRWDREGRRRPVFLVLRDVARERQRRATAHRPHQIRTAGYGRATIAGVVAAVLLALSITLHGFLPRYERDGRYTFDRWTGEVCDRSRCWNPRAQPGGR